MVLEVKTQSIFGLFGINHEVVRCRLTESGQLRNVEELESNQQ